MNNMNTFINTIDTDDILFYTFASIGIICGLALFYMAVDTLKYYRNRDKKNK